MKAKSKGSRLKVWRPQQVGLELMRGVSASYSTPRHFHQELEIAVVQKGSPWEFHYRGAKHIVSPGCFTLTQPGEAHTAHVAGEISCTYYGLRVDSALIENAATEVIGKQKGLPFFVPAVVTNKHLNKLVLDLHIALEKASASLLEQQSLVLGTLAQLILQCAENSPVLQPVGAENQSVKRLRDYLEDNYAENISLEQLAQIANLSPFHLNRAFSKEVGLPPHAYQTQVRIARARTMLTNGWSIGQVAVETGFTSQSHFGWHFKRLIGVTPGQYLKDSKNLIDRDG
ncbi:AraC family transcriptional regulator [Iningainema tapete]|uniref:AraC family transcriptional regulator n=1 Tax=Iningainema tapete BLCC-T55 TaxID=2748662 RepID=A0A8J7C6H8_9CYAN|nr:AraC family transcriptional regulator [Iningainema tapete]MBD2774344.1 AraC family transcriptional regulator [Iningainema tapete BLCC-T55]